MRKTMEVAGLMVLAFLYWITYAALNGQDRLPLRIPTHFDLSGQPNAWGSPQTLWLLPLLGTGLYLLMTVLAAIRFRRFNLPVRVTETNLPFIQTKTAEMVAWIKFEVLGMFAYIQWSIIQGARAGEFHLSVAIVPVFLALTFITVGWYLTAIVRGARARAESSDSFQNTQN
jgi:uncharacterized membrane protein